MFAELEAYVVALSDVTVEGLEHAIDGFDQLSKETSSRNSALGKRATTFSSDPPGPLRMYDLSEPTCNSKCRDCEDGKHIQF